MSHILRGIRYPHVQLHILHFVTLLETQVSEYPLLILN